jgi:hypothetical protein
MWCVSESVDGQYSATLPISKDDVIFGARAVDAAGHVSLAVVPMPVNLRQ